MRSSAILRPKPCCCITMGRKCRPRRREHDRCGGGRRKVPQHLAEARRPHCMRSASRRYGTILTQRHVCACVQATAWPTGVLGIGDRRNGGTMTIEEDHSFHIDLDIGYFEHEPGSRHKRVVFLLTPKMQSTLGGWQLQPVFSSSAVRPGTLVVPLARPMETSSSGTSLPRSSQGHDKCQNRASFERTV